MATSVTACFARVAKTLSPEDREQVLAPLRRDILAQLDAQRSGGADARALAVQIIDRMLADTGEAPAPTPAATSAPAAGPRPAPAPAPAPRPSAKPDAGFSNGQKLAQAMKAQRDAEAAPAPAPAADLPTDADLAADQELQDALSKLGDVLGDVFGAKKNITGPQYSAADLLPTLSKVVELLVRKGFRSFKVATARAAQLMRGNPATASHVDAISPRQWKAAYNAIAEGHDGTDSEDAVGALTADEVRGLVAAPEQAQNPAGNATRPLDRPGSSALEGTPSGDVRAPGEGGNAGSDAAGSRGRDGTRDANAGGAGRDADGGVGDGPAEPPAAGPRGGRTGRTAGGRRGVRNGGSGQSGAEQPADAGRAGDLNPAPNAAPIQPPAFKAQDFTITDELALGEGGQKTKYRANVDAIRLLKDLDATGRAATVDEQKVLARYVGWGGLSQAFDGDNDSWSREYAELKDLLTPDEYADARQSTRYAHYTSREIIGGMYSALRRLGFTGGRMLEPGGGVGNFLGLMPTDLRTASRATLVEREPIAAGIARHLYPQQNIQRADFADFIGTDDYFDAAIGNPPFADTPLTDGSGRKHLSGLSVHNYFFAKSVDHLREGGVLAMVVTSSFLDARGDRARRYIAERTRFLGAIRLPNNAFSKNANTEVTTDIIFLQKRPEAEWGGKAAMQEAQAWLKTAAIADPRGGAELEINQYFADRPEMMLGTYGRYGTMYGPDQPALVAKPEQDTAALLQAAIANLPADVYVPPAVAGTDRLVDQTVVALKDPQVQEGGYYVEGDKLFQRLPDVAGEARAREITPSTQWTEKTTLGDSGYAKLVSLSQMRGTLRALLAAELSGAKTMEPLRGKLNREYDAYVKEHGLLNDQGTTRVFDDDPDFPLLASLEHEYTPGMGIAAAKRQGIKPYRSTAKKAPIFTQRVVQAREQVRRVETPADALAVSIAERGRIDSAYIGELLGRDSQQVLEELSSGSKPLLFRDPATDEYVLRDAYLSGNVRTKLVQARQAGLFTNAQELEKVQPEDVGAANIYARIGSPWVPEDVYRDFALELFGEGTKAAVVYVPLNSSFAVGVKPGSGVASSNTWGTPEYPGEDLLSSLMNNREIKVTYRDQDGKTHVDQDATERANVKAQDIRNRFQDWLFADPDRSEVLVRAYNDTNNNYVTRNYDGSWMTFPGKVPDSIIKFRRHQRNAIARIVQDRTALLDHVVGAGKTFTIVSAAMELKRTGLAKKPLIVVPNHLVKQWASDFYRLYPGAKILTATKKDFAKANRRKFLAKIATGDWDAVVMAHSSFGFLRPAPDFEAQFNQGQVKRIVDTIKAVEDQDGDERAKKRTVKQLEALKERLENRIKSLRQKPIDNLLDYDQIGVDQLFVDEAHLFKNLMFTTKMQNIRGLGDSKGSQRAYDMYVKVAETYAKNGRGQGVVFATGTPVSNTLAEMYHMMRYLMPQAMEDLGFQSFDAWANTFASVNQEWDQKSSGDGFKAINTMSSFVNTHELLRIFDQVADTVTMDDIKAAFREENDGKEFPLPKLKTGRRQPVSLVKSTAQTKYMETIAARAAALERRKGPPQKGEDNALVIMTDARKAAMDVRLVDPAIIEREKGGRIDRAANEVLARWNQYADVKGTQLVFSDLGTPIKTVKAELREYQELQARMAPLADEDLVASAQLGDETAIGKLEDAEAARDELDKKGADWLTAIQAALRGFSVYDDLRAALVERGIPENQIAFIHDYNTDEQKAALFRKVNAGEIRVLMGSTAKLGAGTNVQERLVALHHLDVPWKPSDIEQREGRILRQGNRLEREVPAFEVEILAYVTQDTLDMKMWMIQERKLKMINQLRTRKIDREIENSFEDMEMSAGEMQAAATGNMDMLREIQLRTEVKKLEQRKRAFEAQRNDLESRRRRAEKEIAELPPMIERFDKAASAAEQYNKALRTREVPRSTINGETFTDRDAALKKLRELSDAHERALEQRRQALAETYETAARESRESGMAEGAAINAAEAARDAKDKELPKPKMAVEFNGKTYGSKPALAQAAAEFYGDAHAIEWTLPDGKVLNRRELITKALSQPVAESVSEEAVTEVGSVGPFSVSIEGQRDRRGDKKMLEVLITPEGGEPESEVVYLRGDEDNAAARAAAEVVSAVEMLIFRAGGQADYARSRLESAKRTLAELKKTIVAGEWPEADKLAKARAAHRQVLDRLAGKRDVSTNLKQTGRPEANETDVVFRIDATDLPADTAAAYASTTEADQRAVKRLQLRMVRYIPGVRLDAVAAAGGRAAGQPLQGADRARVAAAELLRALTGRRAVFFKADRAKFVNGVHSSAEPDVLFLRADSSRPHMAVLGHEFLHGLRADRPDLYEALRDRIRLVAPGRAAHGADLQAKRTSVAQPLLDADKLEEEFLADVMGDSWMDAGFWRDLAGKEPSGPLRKAFRAAFRFISDVLGKLADMNPFGSDVYLSDVRAARKAMAQALREYVQVESVGAPEIDGDSFSIDSATPRQTDTPEFKRWFGDSKVVDAQGKPLVVYHGTKNDTDFGAFNTPAHFGTAEQANTIAESFFRFGAPADALGDSPRVMPVYLSIKDPIYIKDTGVQHGPVEYLEAAYERGAISFGEREAILYDENNDRRDDAEIQRLLMETLEGLGYDGFIYDNKMEGEGTSYTVFRPEQIKSATGNRGTFDPNEADIRLSRALTRRDVLLGTAAAALAGDAGAKTTLGKAQPIPASVMRAALPADVQKILIGGGVGTTNISGAKAVKEALERIAETGPQELRALAKRTAALMPEGRLMLTVVGGRWNAHGAVSWGGPEGPHLRLMNGAGMDGLTYGTFIHESMHAAVLARYIHLNTAVVRDNDAKLGGAPAASKQLDQFRQVWQEFKEASRGQRVADAELQLAIDEARSNPDEFFVRALTDPLLQAHMATMEYRGKTLWDRFKDWVKTTLFGLGPSEGVTPSWLDAALTASQDLLEAMPRDAPDYSRLGKYRSLRDGATAKYSLAVDALQSNETARRLSERAMDVIRSDSTIGVLGRTVGTPYHLAHAKRADGSLRNPDLRRVYDEAQDYLNDINTFANDPAELAPGVVPMLNKWSDVARPLRLAGEQRAKLARALFEGTLGWTRDDQGNPVQTEDTHQGIEWTATELKQRFGFDDADVGRYQQTRAAIGRSLDYMAAAEVARQMGGRDLPEGLRAMVSRGDTGRFRGLVTNFLTQQVDGAKFALSMLKTEHRQQLASITGPDADAKRVALKAKQAIALEVAQERLDKWQGLQRGVQKVYDRVTDLKDRGYMPLMRFGPHTVTVRDIDTKEVVFFGMYETQAEANVEARRLRESATPNEAVSRGEMSQEQWRLFKGMSPETIELFGQVAGVERTPVFEEYIRRTKANHSALKRLIQRKGTPGFSEDVQRVLAAFLTSNARAAAANLHAGAMEEATQDIDQERGLVKDYATKLTQYVQNPSDEAQAIRGLMFVQYIGGSVASAMVNMTQPFTMTLPYLSQYGGPAAAARLLTAGMRSALSRIDPKSDLGKAMARAEKDGIVSPQALHELQGQAVNRFGRTESFLRSLGVSTKAAEAIDASLRRVLFAWGGFFSLAEQFNRRATFIAAYQLAQEKGMADAFAFAEEAVTETQGQYSRANRPQWARGPVMSTVFTFKQFSIAYIEFLARLPRREKAIAMAVLLVAAGLEGLPFADDLDDLIDTIAQRIFGKAFSAKRAKVELLSEVLGRDGAEWVLRGASALPGFPVDLAGRMSLGNMIPGTGLLRTDGSRDKSAEVLEALGPAGGVVRDAIGEGSLVERFAPVAMRNAAKALEMNRTGEYRDKLGRKVADVDGADAAAKALGFQPREIARESRGSRMSQSIVAQTRSAESEIVRLWAQGIVDNEPDKVAEARARLDAWNERNPTARIAINRMQIARQVRDMRATREERLIRATPKELRGRVAQELQQ